jgi:hypothetical protein
LVLDQSAGANRSKMPKSNAGIAIASNRFAMPSDDLHILAEEAGVFHCLAEQNELAGLEICGE